MAAVGSKITVAVDPPCAYLRITGRAAVESSRDFKALILQLTSEGISRFVLDLRDCLLMDSTFSGVLAGLVSPRASEPPRPLALEFTVVQPNERVTDLLDNLGVLPLVRRLNSSPIPVSGPIDQEMPAGVHSKTEVAECCLEAHQILMALKPENVAKFRSLEQVLTAQLGMK